MIMKSILAAGLVVASIGVALADSDRVAPNSQVQSQLNAQGVTPTKMKMDDGQVKVKGYNASGQKVKEYINPTTGAVEQKHDD